MRHLLKATLALALLLVLAGCGGSGEDLQPQASDLIPRLNQHEERLTGAYELSGFLIQRDGVWKTGEQVAAWNGTLYLAYDHQASMMIELDGEIRMHTWMWSADDAYLTFDGAPFDQAGAVAAWALTDDGTLQTSFVLAGAGDDAETWLWRRSGS